MTTAEKRQVETLDRIEAKLDLIAAALGYHKAEFARIGFGRLTPTWLRRRFRRALRDEESEQAA